MQGHAATRPLLRQLDTRMYTKEDFKDLSSLRHRVGAFVSHAQAMDYLSAMPSGRQTGRRLRNGNNPDLEGSPVEDSTLATAAQDGSRPAQDSPLPARAQGTISAGGVRGDSAASSVLRGASQGNRTGRGLKALGSHGLALGAEGEASSSGEGARSQSQRHTQIIGDVGDTGGFSDSQWSTREVGGGVGVEGVEGEVQRTTAAGRSYRERWVGLGLVPIRDAHLGHFVEALAGLAEVGAHLRRASSDWTVVAPRAQGLGFADDAEELQGDMTFSFENSGTGGSGSLPLATLSLDLESKMTLFFPTRSAPMRCSLLEPPFVSRCSPLSIPLCLCPWPFSGGT